ncbi:MAG: DUF2892 domain-containing protein [Kofleriaceae bacterium]|nr:DUF2892 domain-containing protein [Kofleriaceae bacterium]MBP9172303.1 DUF2892 domain-containing protein [Kofleriaceae bacterium]MBP9860358.1 DUF2892 domain-containing protein [Kofleriaceae bacterium]
MKTLTLTAAVLTLAVLAPTASADHVNFGASRRVASAAEPTRVAAAEPGAMEASMMPMPEASPRETTIFGLPKNVGTGDRILRTVVGLGLAGVGLYGLQSGELSDTTSGVLLGVSTVPFATAATGYCPLYQLVGIDRSF